MDLNNIELPASVIASLYPSSLVAVGSEEKQIQTRVPDPVSSPNQQTQAANEPPQSFTWKFLGNNKKAVLVVVNHTDILHLPDEDLSFLTNMLTACKLSLGDIILINYNNYLEKGGPAALKHFKSREVLLFGIQPSEFGLPVNFPEYQVQAVANVQYVFSPALGEIANDKTAKGKLWGCLKKIFGI
ncbi:MAG: hypothetical protein DI535_07335 [Citrobacter freundii]|nr:MAG: hypothetical protein DI535_07335 [Citrobacter freundii]